MVDFGTETKATVDDAVNAASVAQNSLASIDTRVGEIKEFMTKAKSLQQDHEEMKFNLDATENALSALEGGGSTVGGDDGVGADANVNEAGEEEGGQRQKRSPQTAEIDARLAKIRERQNKIKALLDQNKNMFKTLEKQVVEARKELSE